MTKMTFATASGYFWTILANVDSKNVLTLGGRVGTKGLRRRLHFATRDEVRAYVESRIETKMAKGFVQVA